MTIFGWDASDYDSARGPMDMKAAKAAGITFFSHKATEQAPGEVFRHSKYGPVMNRARDAGIEFLSAYIVPRTGVATATQVKTFLDYLDQQTPWWRTFPGFFLQTDLERWDYDSVEDEVGEDVVRALRSATGKTVLLYASHGQYGSSIDSDMLKWNANYAAENAATRDYRDIYNAVGGDTGVGWAPYSGPAPLIWQYASDSTIGTQPTCDANAFRGSLDDFRKLIVPSVPSTPGDAAFNQAFNLGYNVAYNKAFQIGFSAGWKARHGG